MTSQSDAAAARGSVAADFFRKPTAASPRLKWMLALDDFEAAARRHLPRMLYGYVAGAVETGAAFREARAAFEEWVFLPEVLNDVSARAQSTDLFGERHAAPFGIAPMGAATIAAYRGDIALARAARAAGIPAVQSAASLTRLEDVQAAAPGTWFQAYLAGDQARVDAMIDRVAAAGVSTLVLTVDVPVLGNRENNVRSGYSSPFVVTPRLALDCALHPRWLLGTLGRTFMTSGMPHFENLDATRGPPLFSRNLARNSADRDRFAWRHVEAIRRRWRGNLVIKGLLRADDARRARALGADGIIVSSHGGRQLDHAIAPLRVLPDIVAAADGLKVMLDGGIRRGTDVLKALALGADFVFVGRPMMFAAAIAGEAGAAHAIRLLMEEIDRDLALLGIASTGAIRPDHLRRKTPPAA